MPQIIVTTDGPGSTTHQEVHRERVHASDVESDTSSHRLVERIGWALSDAREIEVADYYEEDPTAGFTRPTGGIADTKVHGPRRSSGAADVLGRH